MDQPGQPTKYEEEFARQAGELCELGATDLKLAKFFGVAKATVNNWKREHPEFAEAVRSGKDRFDSEKVEQSLLRRAQGYKFVEVTREASPVFEVVKNPDGSEESRTLTGQALAVTRRVTMDVPPHVVACIFWLKNRANKRWKDARELTGKDGGPIEVSNLTDDQLESKISELLSKAGIGPAPGGEGAAEEAPQDL